MIPKGLQILCWVLLAAMRLPGQGVAGMDSAEMEEVAIVFRIAFQGEEIELGKEYDLGGSDGQVLFENIRFYVSQVQLWEKGSLVSPQPPAPKLVDADQGDSQTLRVMALAGAKIDRISFHLGLDSLTNVSGALGGDLDPTRGMYWTWQSGYVNFKLEGQSPVCPSRNHAFTFHLGGYLSPFASMQSVELACTHSDRLVIEVAIDELLGQIDLGETYKVMSPGKEAVEMSRMLPAMFSVSR